jgi:hypothetical protein
MQIIKMMTPFIEYIKHIDESSCLPKMLNVISKLRLHGEYQDIWNAFNKKLLDTPFDLTSKDEFFEDY